MGLLLKSSPKISTGGIPTPPLWFSNRLRPESGLSELKLAISDLTRSLLCEGHPESCTTPLGEAKTTSNSSNNTNHQGSNETLFESLCDIVRTSNQAYFLLLKNK